jgi:hypothetical protein
MNRYKTLIGRVPDSPNAERNALYIPDAPPVEKETPPFARFAAAVLATAVLIVGGVFAWRHMDGMTPGGGTESPGAAEPPGLSIPAVAPDPDIIYFDTWEKACQTVPFKLVRPTFIPGGSDLDFVGVSDPKYGYSAHLHYGLSDFKPRNVYDLSEAELAAYMYISQHYIGPERHPLDFSEAEGEITTVWQDDVEITVHQYIRPGMTLYWQPGEILYTLYAFHDLDTLLAVVDSMK